EPTANSVPEDPKKVAAAPPAAQRSKWTLVPAINHQISTRQSHTESSEEEEDIPSELVPDMPCWSGAGAGSHAEEILRDGSGHATGRAAGYVASAVIVSEDER
ncbi:MAG: hypothetical protein LQ346_008330, partial [Caloplaca aetnensis]